MLCILSWWRGPVLLFRCISTLFPLFSWRTPPQDGCIDSLEVGMGETRVLNGLVASNCLTWLTTYLNLECTHDGLSKHRYKPMNDVLDAGGLLSSLYLSCLCDNNILVRFWLDEGRLCLVKRTFLLENVDLFTHLHLSNNMLDHMSGELVIKENTGWALIHFLEVELFRFPMHNYIQMK